MKNLKKSNTIPHFGILYLLLDTVISLILLRAYFEILSTENKNFDAIGSDFEMFEEN